VRWIIHKKGWIKVVKIQKKIPTKIFEIQDSFHFSPIKVEHQKEEFISDLSILIQKDTAKKEKALKNVVTFALTIFLPTLEAVTIQVEEKSSVEQVIINSLNQYNLECSDKTRQVRINMNPKAYVLRFAEDDGTPDDVMPALVKTQEIGQFKGCTKYALCPDTSFKVVMSSTNEVKIQPTRPPLKVFLPKFENSGGGGYVTVAYQPKMTLEEIMINVCEKRALNPHDYAFEFASQDMGIMKTGLNKEKTFEELGVDSLMLIDKKNAHKRSQSRNSVGLKNFKNLSKNFLEIGEDPKGNIKK